MISIVMQLQSSYWHEGTGFLPSVVARRNLSTRFAQSPDALRAEDSALRSAIARDSHLNVLVHCVDIGASPAFEALTDLCPQRPHTCVIPGPLDLPDDDTRPLLIGDVSLLTLNQQIALYDWQDQGHDSTQIISLTSRSLWPLVTSGRFLEGLFYRLNVMSVQASMSL
jgi:hypothetical protein